MEKYITNLKQILLNTDKTIINWISSSEFNNYRVYYGYAFSIMYLNMRKLINANSIDLLLRLHDSLDKESSEYHWEFNNYAFSNTHIENKNFSKYLYPLKFKNTVCTNWTLLRCNVKLRLNYDKKSALIEAKKRIIKFQLKSGLILDEPGVKSFQYHCFSAAMLSEIYCLTNDEFFLIRFLLATKFIKNFILPSGETLYIGRGQYQSFGYSTLIYILSMYHYFTFDRNTLNEIEKVSDYILSYIRPDYSFPLVLNNMEKQKPFIVDLMDPQYCGWYPYNNYFDYTPFMGVFIAKSFDILKNVSSTSLAKNYFFPYKDSNFIKFSNSRYIAILSRPGGYWTNDLPIPYIYTKENTITPIYGGEQFQKSLYDLESIPLPYFYKLKLSIRKHSFSFFYGNTLFVISLYGLMIRRFFFMKEEININTWVFSPFKFKHVYIFLNNIKVHSRNTYDYFGNYFSFGKDLKYGGMKYSASGKLKMFYHFGTKSHLKIFVNGKL